MYSCFCCMTFKVKKKIFFKKCIIFVQAFIRYSWSIFKTDSKRIIVRLKKKPLLGPMNFCRFDFDYGFKSYSVILDTEKTSFHQFERYILSSKAPLIPNRAIMSTTIDISKFNQFLGPLCDFYINYPGALKPYSIDFFRNMNKTVPRLQYSLHDTQFIEQVFECMSRSYNTKWKSDLKKVEVDIKRNERNASNKENFKEKKVHS